ncbi:MFS transporter [Streptomyces sp. NPDC058442]|uniref:MFS transporter n=1 Tax=Streptomyces sp. NPDC058442 TaxID=3346503 RepID=UPI0036585B56
MGRVIPPRGAPRKLALAQLTNSVGDGAYYVCAVLYFNTVVGLSATRIGAALTLGWVLGAVLGVPLGHLADRRGPRRVAIWMALATGAAVGSFLFVRSYPAFMVAVCVYACAQCGLAAARQALLADLVEPGRRTQTRAYLQSTVNAGLALGAALGGIALQLDSEPAYLTALAMDALSFFLAGLMLRRLPERARTEAGPAESPSVRGEPRMVVLRDRPYAVVSLLNMVMLLYMPLLSVALPLWVVQRTEAPGWTVSALLVLNTVSVVLFQVRIAGRVTGLKSASRAVRHSGYLLLLACVVFALSSLGTSAWAAGVLLLAAAAIQVFGEMLLGSGSWEIGFGLAPDGKQGQYQGFYGAGTAIARLIGPLLLTALILSWGVPGWLVLGGLFLAAGTGMGPAVRWAAAGRAGGGTRAVPGREPSPEDGNAPGHRTPKGERTGS